MTRKEFAGGTALVAMTFVAAAIVVRLTVRDSTIFSAPFFYATPWPVIAAAAIFALILAWIDGRRKLAALCFVIAAGVLLFWMRSWPRHDPRPGDLRVAVWNARRSTAPAAAEFARSLDANITAIVEIPSSDEAVLASWRKAFDGFKVQPLKHGILLAARGKTDKAQQFAWGKRNRATATRVHTSIGSVVVIIVDIDGNPLRSRQGDFAMLGTIIDTYSSLPLIVLGDFNTPLDSLLFSTLRSRGFTHAFETAGNQSPETWPRQAPVLTIDHIWLSEQLVARSARKEKNSASDHHAVIAEISVRLGR